MTCVLRLLDLPLRLGIMERDLTSRIGYIKAPDADAAKWQRRLTVGRVGLVWKGRSGPRE